MSRRNKEILMGLFVAAGLAALFLVAMQPSKLTSNSVENETYEITARFDNVGGLKTLSSVKAAGVKIGSVVNIEYDSTGYEAVVTLSIKSQYDKFPIDTAASVLTTGLLGEQYIGLEPGAETEFLTGGSEIDITQSALVLEQIIGQFLYSKANE